MVSLGLVTAVAVAGEEQTLTGEYRWKAGKEGALEAVFTPTGEGEWEVDFHFKFRGGKHVYSGTATGSLTEGALEGTVFNESKKRTFTFAGDFEDGKFSGKHAEITGGHEQSTGTLTLGG